MKEIKKVCVVGAGNMGHQLAMLCAMHGYKTCCCDNNKAALDKFLVFCDEYLAGRVAKGRITQEQADAARKNISVTTELAEACADVDAVIEAATENLDIKRAIFKTLSDNAPKDAIFGTNSSTHVSSKLKDVVENPSRLCNIHFFNPALVMKTVEVVKGEHTSAECAKDAYDFCLSLGKEPVMLNKEIWGFAVNRVLLSMRREACALVDKGIISPEDLDKAVKGALGHPMGVFELIDLTGIDLEVMSWESMYADSGREEDKVPNVIMEKYKLGEYGRKTGKGFYTYK